ARRAPVPIGQQDLLPVLVPRLVEAMRAGATGDDQVLAVLTTWAADRPAEPAPLLLRAEYLRLADKAAAAAATLHEAERLEPRSERILRQQALVADRLYAAAGQDGASLFEQCQRRQTTRPDVPSPIC